MNADLIPQNNLMVIDDGFNTVKHYLSMIFHILIYIE